MKPQISQMTQIKINEIGEICGFIYTRTVTKIVTMKKIAALLLLAFTGIYASNNSWAQEKNLPAGFAPGEELKMQQYLSTRAAASKGIPNPPGGALRTMAEWEEVQAVTITWTSYQDILREIVRHAKLEAKVIIVCSDSNSVKSYLAAGGVDAQNVEFIEADYNSVWCRDYGAHTVYRNDVDSLILVDWIYNRPRPFDDVIPDVISSYTGFPLYSTTQSPYDLMSPGGNFFNDGFGTGFSSKLVLEENDGSGGYPVEPDHTEAEIDSIMKWFMGIGRYIKMDELPYDGIHHIDMHMKPLDEETILVGEYPGGVADGPQIETNLQYILNNFPSKWGTDYKVVRVEMPPDQWGNYPNEGADYRTFTNSIFINGTILVPIYEEQYDTIALRIYRESLTGYKVVGIDCNDIIPAKGALHCITKLIGVENPLLISHQPLSNYTTDYQVDAYINHISGIANATIYWTTDTTAGWQTASMTETNAATHTWTGYIPEQDSSITIYYYIHALANSGKHQTRPIVAPSGWWKFYMLVTGLEELQVHVEMSIFPNPAGDYTYIPITTDHAVDVSLNIYNLLGQKVVNMYQGTVHAGQYWKFLDASELESGIYTVVLETGSQRIVEKLVVL
ncbi:MAG: agmatine deiminase family protein [Bacteroidota bacterium]